MLLQFWVRSGTGMFLFFFLMTPFIPSRKSLVLSAKLAHSFKRTPPSLVLCSCVLLPHCVFYTWGKVTVRYRIRSKSQGALPTGLLLSASGWKGLRTPSSVSLWTTHGFCLKSETCDSPPRIPPTCALSPKKDKLRNRLWVMCSEILSTSPPEYPR